VMNEWTTLCLSEHYSCGTLASAARISEVLMTESINIDVCNVLGH
jgi:hypothetical protein